LTQGRKGIYRHVGGGQLAWITQQHPRDVQCDVTLPYNHSLLRRGEFELAFACQRVAIVPRYKLASRMYASQTLPRDTEGAVQLCPSS
jgi:hypothetical protein